MDKSERIHAEMEAKLTQFGETLNQLRRNTELQKERHEAFHRSNIEEIEKRHREAEKKLKELSSAKEHDRGHLSSQLKTFMSDMDEQLREAMTYYK